MLAQEGNWYKGLVWQEWMPSHSIPGDQRGGGEQSDGGDFTTPWWGKELAFYGGRGCCIAQAGLKFYVSKDDLELLILQPPEC